MSQKKTPVFRSFDQNSTQNLKIKAANPRKIPSVHPLLYYFPIRAFCFQGTLCTLPAMSLRSLRSKCETLKTLLHKPHYFDTGLTWRSSHKKLIRAVMQEKRIKEKRQRQFPCERMKTYCGAPLWFPCPGSTTPPRALANWWRHTPPPPSRRNGTPVVTERPETSTALQDQTRYRLTAGLNIRRKITVQLFGDIIQAMWVCCFYDFYDCASNSFSAISVDRSTT